MKTGRNRLGRQDQPSFGRAIGERRQRLARCAASLVAVAALALTAAPAQAVTGGASTVADSGAQAGSEIAFAPMQWAGATWYGPGLYGRNTACGQLLGPDTIGVADRERILG